MGKWLRIDLVFGLYVYCRLLQLSLDRAGEKPRDELRAFFVVEHLPLPGVVSSAIETCLAEIGAGPSVPRRLCIYLRLRMGFTVSKIWLCEGELDKVRSVLAEAKKLFRLSNTEIVQQRNDIRSSIVDLQRQLTMFLPSDLERKGLKVRHLNHAKHLKLSSFIAIVGSNWPSGE